MELKPEIGLLRQLYLNLRLFFSRKTRDELEEVQVLYEYVKELLIRKKAKRSLEARPWVEHVDIETEPVNGMEVVEYEDDALDELIDKYYR